MYSRLLPLVMIMALWLEVYSNKIIIPDNSPTIQNAIEKANKGDTVFVRIGRWEENIVLRDSIVLMGESVTETIIKGKKNKPVVKGANGALIKKVTIIGGRVGILCENTEMTIEEVMVKGNKESGIHCLISLPNIYNSIIYRNKTNGIFCEGTRSLRTSIIHNIIADNGNCGIMLSGHSEVLIKNNVIMENKQYGIWGSEESKKSRIIHNDFYNNRAHVNVYLVKDPTNISEDPGYQKVNGEYDFFSATSIMLKGKGKDGADIGLIGGEVLYQKVNDPDEDGVDNSKDKCPEIPEDLDGFEDEDGCPEFDNDKDGFFDSEDACPNDPEDYDGFRDDDGCNDYDNDKDNIPDSVDVCKNESEVFNGYKDDDGCPDVAPSKELKKDKSESKSDKIENKEEEKSVKEEEKETPATLQK